MSKDRLLSDEELTEQLKQVYRDGYYSNNNTETDTFKAHLFWFTEHIDTQKRLYAESVIGEDEKLGVYSTYSFLTHDEQDEKKIVLNELRAEQRARIK